MKTTTIKTLIKDKDLNNEQSMNEFAEAINSDINTLVKSKEEEWTTSLNEYKQKLELANAQAKNATELAKKLEEIEKNNNVLKNKLYITKKVSNELDEETIEDILILANSKVSQDKSIEQAIEEASSRFIINKKSATPTTIQSSTPKANVATGINQEKIDKERKEEQRSWILKQTAYNG